MSHFRSMQSLSRRQLLVAVAGTGLFGTAIRADAQATEVNRFPNKPLQIIVGFPPGGSGDFIARLIAEEMAKFLGQQVLVVNRPGAATNIASEAVARAAADGYTLLMGGSFSHSVNPALFAKLPYDPITSFTPIGKVASLPTVLVVNASLPVNSVQEFIDYARREGDKVSYASAGIGSPGHIAGGYFNKVANLRMTHVPYKGAGEAVRGLIGGDVQLIITSPPSIMSFVAQGRAKALAVTTAKPSPLVPGVPGAEEAGLRNFDVDGWYGLYGPANLPAELVQTIFRALNQSLALPAIKERFESQGASVQMSTSPDAFTKFGQEDRLRWAGIVKDSGARID